MTFHPNIPFNDLPLLPPETSVLTPSVLEKAAEAGQALSELDRMFRDLGSCSFLINSLVLLEAKDSSEIENIYTSHEDVFKASVLGPEGFHPATSEVLRYHDAFWEAWNVICKSPFISNSLYVKIVRRIKDDHSGIRQSSGARIVDFAAGKVVYAPPEGEAVIRKKLKNLEDFIHSRDGMDPLIKLALVHYQFEAIHPFPDGNGRTGRILNILLLQLYGLLGHPGLNLSRYIVQREREYYRLLNEVSEKGAWEPWILFMMEAIRETAVCCLETISAIRKMVAATVEKAERELPSGVFSDALAAWIFRQPYIRIRSLVDAGIAEKETAEECLGKLEEIGVVKKVETEGGTLFYNEALFDLLIQ